MKVGKGDAVTYVALVISAALLALEPWRKEAAVPPESHPILSSSAWAYIPLVLLVLVGCIWLYRQIAHLLKGRSEPPVATTQNEVAATAVQRRDEIYSDDPEGEALDKAAYNQLVAFCMDNLLPACRAQTELQDAMIRHFCNNPRVVDFAITGMRDEKRFKTGGFWENYWNLASGLTDSPGPTIKFEGMIRYISELEREFYKNFCDQAWEVAAAGGLKPNAPVFFEEWNRWYDHHRKMKKVYEQLQRDIRFGKLHRLRPSRWGDFQPA
jgi:hypothetical protein